MHERIVLTASNIPNPLSPSTFYAKYRRRLVHLQSTTVNPVPTTIDKDILGTV